MAATNLTADLLRQLVDYTPSTGLFTWKRRPVEMFKDLRACEAWNGRYAGKAAGGRSGDYIGLRINGRSYLAHRLAWLYVHGVWPGDEVDHRNGNRFDNSINNLRSANRNINAQNIRSRPANAEALPLGVYLLKRKAPRPYSASIRIGGRARHLGYFLSAEEAHAAYLTAKRTHHEGCTI